MSQGESERAAADIQVELYPGALAVRSTTTFRRGNYRRADAVFISTDSPEEVAKFYASKYSSSVGDPDAEGKYILHFSVESVEYILEAKPSQGKTWIAVTRLETCEGAYPEPCNQREGE